MVADDRIHRLVFNPEPGSRRVAQRPEHPHGVFGKAEVRLGDHANDPRLDVLDAVNVVEHRECFQVIEETVDGQVPAPGIFLGGAVGVVPEDDPALGPDDTVG